MRVWRITRRPYADLSGQGAALYPGRWNRSGQKLVYTAEHPALAVLEIRVHLGLELDEIPIDYVIMEIDLGAARIELRKKSGTEKTNKSFGSKWLREARSAVLGVPSVLVPKTMNYLINPNHPEATSISLIGLTDFTIEPRIIRGKENAP